MVTRGKVWNTSSMLGTLSQLLIRLTSSRKRTCRVYLLGIVHQLLYSAVFVRATWENHRRQVSGLVIDDDIRTKEREKYRQTEIELQMWTFRLPRWSKWRVQAIVVDCETHTSHNRNYVCKSALLDLGWWGRSDGLVCYSVRAKPCSLAFLSVPVSYERVQA